MKYGELRLENGAAVEINAREISQSEMTSECWSIQFRGPKACKDCECRGRDCGGKAIRKTGKNAIGFVVPLGKIITSLNGGRTLP